jgi:hypothetical protein
MIGLGKRPVGRGSEEMVWGYRRGSRSNAKLSPGRPPPPPSLAVVRPKTKVSAVVSEVCAGASGSLQRGQHLIRLERDVGKRRRAHLLAPCVPPDGAVTALAHLGVDLDDA